MFYDQLEEERGVVNFQQKDKNPQQTNFYQQLRIGKPSTDIWIIFIPIMQNFNQTTFQNQIIIKQLMCMLKISTLSLLLVILNAQTSTTISRSAFNQLTQFVAQPAENSNPPNQQDPPAPQPQPPPQNTLPPVNPTQTPNNNIGGDPSTTDGVSPLIVQPSADDNTGGDSQQQISVPVIDPEIVREPEVVSGGEIRGEQTPVQETINNNNDMINVEERQVVADLLSDQSVNLHSTHSESYLYICKGNYFRAYFMYKTSMLQIYEQSIPSNATIKGIEAEGNIVVLITELKENPQLQIRIYENRDPDFILRNRVIKFGSYAGSVVAGGFIYVFQQQNMQEVKLQWISGTQIRRPSGTGFCPFKHIQGSYSWDILKISLTTQQIWLYVYAYCPQSLFLNHNPQTNTVCASFIDQSSDETLVMCLNSTTGRLLNGWVLEGVVYQDHFGYYGEEHFYATYSSVNKNSDSRSIREYDSFADLQSVLAHSTQFITQIIWLQNHTIRLIINRDSLILQTKNQIYEHINTKGIISVKEFGDRLIGFGYTPDGQNIAIHLINLNSVGNLQYLESFNLKAFWSSLQYADINQPSFHFDQHLSIMVIPVSVVENKGDPLIDGFLHLKIWADQPYIDEYPFLRRALSDPTIIFVHKNNQPIIYSFSNGGYLVTVSSCEIESRLQEEPSQLLEQFSNTEEWLFRNLDSVAGKQPLCE